MKYFKTSAIELFNGRWNGDSQAYEHKTISIWTKSVPDTDGIVELDEGSFINKEEYEALCIKHNDIGYNREVPAHPVVRFTNLDFISISITSDAAFDNNHPAGAELGDLVTFYSVSPAAYIQSGYTIETGELTPFTKLVSDLTASDLVLLGRGSDLWLANLAFVSEPTLAKMHQITVTMTADDGQEFSSTVQVVWE